MLTEIENKQCGTKCKMQSKKDCEIAWMARAKWARENFTLKAW